MKRGRKTKYSEDKIAEIFSYFEQGIVHLKDALSLAGIGERTWYDWLQKKPELSSLIEKAKIEFKRSCIQKISRSSDWRAQAFLLERMFFEEFADRSKVEHTMEQAFAESIREILAIIKEYIPLHHQKEILVRFERFTKNMN